MNAPEHLDAQAQQKWVEVLPILESRGDVDQGSLDALTAYAVSWSRWLQAEAQVTALGLIVKSPAGFPTENPYLAVAKKALIEMHRWGKELRLVEKAKRKTEEPPESAVLKILRQIG